MGAEDKYSVLLMRDNSSVRRFRLSPFMLKMGLYSLLLLILATGVCAYAAYTYWRESSQLLAERQAYERQLLETQVKLERLQNVERILTSNNPEELRSMFGLAKEEEPAPAPVEPAVQEEPEPPQPPAEEPAPAMVENPTDLADLLGVVDLGQAQMGNIRLVRDENEPTAFHLTFDLSNKGPEDEPLTGRGQVLLITNTGRKLPADISRSDLSFQIQRFKSMSALFQLPEGVVFDELYAVKLIINDAQGRTILSAVLPLAGLLG